MPDYVYALHDFLPEHEDEVSFHAGERIEVVERDDLYGDGWWQGRNLAGKVGLFPQSYTAPAPPSGTPLAQSTSTSSNTSEGTVGNGSISHTKGPLSPLQEESEPAVSMLSRKDYETNIVAPIPKAPAILLNGGSETSENDVGHRKSLSAGGDGEVMKATMTDVQKAIEQLGKGHSGDGDGARSFSFASTKDPDTEVETDTDFSDVDAGPEENREDWHKNVRAKLARNAQRAVEEAEKLEALMAAPTDRRLVPPIEVEMSDESDDEHDHDREDFTTRSSQFQREHPYIPEEEEEETDGSFNVKQANLNGHGELNGHDNPATNGDERSATAPFMHSADDNSTTLTMPEPKPEPEPESHTESQTVTAPAPSSSALSPLFPLPSERRAAHDEKTKVETLKHASMPTPVPMPAPAEEITNLVSFPEEEMLHSPPQQMPRGPPPPPLGPAFNAPNTSSPAVRQESSAASTTVAGSSPLEPLSTTSMYPPVKQDISSPSDWTVEEVVAWLQKKGFDHDVCDKFVEQEITGDVLLELDVNLLKTEIGIIAFGKRMRIANAITDLRRPPSIVYSDQPEPSPVTYGPVHSRTQSQSQSHHSFPGAQSYQSSIGSPLAYGFSNSHAASTATTSPQAPVHGQQPLGYGQPPSPSPILESPSRFAAESPVVQTNGHNDGVANEVNTVRGVGLGIGTTPDTKIVKGRPAQLMLSPSDGALGTTARSVSEVLQQAEDEERGHMSEGEAISTNTNTRRRLFGRDSTSTRHSKDFGSPVPSVSTVEKEKDTLSVGGRHARAKKSVDGHKAGDRLSIFGGTFGKSRKPAPSSSEEGLVEKPSMFSLPRLGGNSIRKASNSSTSPTTVHLEDAKDRTNDKDRVLRKRITSSNTNMAEASQASAVPSGEVTQGQSILDQIGEPDHAGWMRKRGDRMNSWKSRYFVLKGPHLYCMKSSHKAETKIKGYIHVVGYKVTVDENVDPGRYGFRIDHDHDKTHYFSSEEKPIIREWMKAIMKATIGRDYTKPVVSSCNIPTIPLVVAQAMNPAPRPPSPTARAATQKALRRENPDQLSSRDARILMGVQNEGKDDRTPLTAVFIQNEFNEDDAPSSLTPKAGETPVPPRPTREIRRGPSYRSVISPVDDALITWANTHLPEPLQITDPSVLCGGLGLLRIAESIRGRPSSPPVPDSWFPSSPADDKLDGLFKLFDFLLDNEVKMGSVSINDIRQGKRDKVLQLLRALKTWEEKKRAVVNSSHTNAPLGTLQWSGM